MQFEINVWWKYKVKLLKNKTCRDLKRELGTSKSFKFFIYIVGKIKLLR